MSDPDCGATCPAATDLHRVWSEQLRATDEISLKLLAIVPTITAVGISLLIPKDLSAKAASPQMIAIGIFGAWISFLVYLWERRNIQICKWHRDRISAIEKAELGVSERVVNADDVNLGDPPPVLKWNVGKSSAECLIYTSVIVAWLALAVFGLVVLVFGVA